MSPANVWEGHVEKQPSPSSDPPAEYRDDFIGPLRPLPSGWYPRCFASRTQYQEWQTAAEEELALRVKALRRERKLDETRPEKAASICEDCTPEHQARMIRAGRCAFPATTFKPTEDGGTHGEQNSWERRE